MNRFDDPAVKPPSQIENPFLKTEKRNFGRNKKLNPSLLVKSWLIVVKGFLKYEQNIGYK